MQSTLVTALAAVASAKHCRELTIPVSLSARNALFDMDAPTEQLDITDFFLHATAAGVNYTEEILQGYYTLSGDYKLKATYCTPNDGPGSTLQILTHGVGFDRHYWDAKVHGSKDFYSYVDKAVDEFGYSTVAWDRLGIGASSHGDPLHEIQASLEVAALHELTNAFATGHVSDLETGYPDIVHVGHSFGSVLTYNLANMWPESTSGIALTGFSQVASFLPEFALAANWVPVSQIKALKNEYAPGYYAVPSTVGLHINFFGTSGFEPKMLDYAFDTAQPFAAGEALTVLQGTDVPNKYPGPVLIITGDLDIPFCGGNCSDTPSGSNTKGAKNLIDYSKHFFERASTFNATIVPGAAHGLNYLSSAPTTFNTILDFFGSHCSHGN